MKKMQERINGTLAFDVYRNMLELIMGEKLLQADKTFRICLPKSYVASLSELFPQYKHSVLGESIQDDDSVDVMWIPRKTAGAL